MKRLIYLFSAFMFGFMCFSSNVHADIADISDSFNFYDKFSDEQLTILDEFLTDYVKDNNLINYACFVHDMNNASDVYVMFYCGSITLNVTRYTSNSVDLSLSPYNYISFYFYFSDNRIASVNSNSGYNLSLFSSFYKSKALFWTSDSFVINDGSFSIDDTEYSEISDNYKQHYDFKDYLVTGKPLYSIYHLKYGGWKGYKGSVNLVYCIDNVCDNSSVYEYKYGIVNEEIDLKDNLDSSYNGYKLDNSKNYIINAGVTEELKVYYYSTDVEYTINYYYDDVLQEDLTEVKKATVNSTITLDNLSEVVDNIYFLDKEKDYSIVLSDSKENVINVYYLSYDMNYNVNIYLDDIYYQSHSFIGVAKRGSEVVLEDLSETINIYTLDNREYNLSVSENSQLNYINVYYYSENYNTQFQDIDTSGKYFISFDWVYIKDLFNLNGNFTQTEQFIIVYVVNILFYVIIALFIYVGLKMINKLFSFFNMF